MVEAKLVESKHGVDKLLLKNIDVTLLNSVRRVIMNAVPVLAVQDVNVYENTSVMFDEMLAHRLGLIPLQTDKSYAKGDKVKLSLDKEGPGTVYSGDMKSSDPKV